MVIFQDGGPILLREERFEYAGHEWVLSGTIMVPGFVFGAVQVHTGPIWPEDRYQRMLKAVLQTVALAYVQARPFAAA